MHTRFGFQLAMAMLLHGAACAAFAAQAMSTRVDDPRAVDLSAAEFGVHGDGKSDDSAALQAAIDKSETNREGIVFVPAGRYLLTRTVFVWPGVRLFGYGATRPVFVLAANTPGFQQGDGVVHGIPRRARRARWVPRAVPAAG